MKKLSKFLISTIGCELVGIAATPFTLSSIPGWYQTLNKPSFSPPNWIFGLVVDYSLFFNGSGSLSCLDKRFGKAGSKNSAKFFYSPVGI